MSKKLVKSIASAAAALLMATQAMAFSASAVQEFYYYYNGVYYSSPYDAADAAGGNHGAYYSVPYGKVPSTAKLKYYDAVNKKFYDTKADAEAASVKNPVEVYVGTNNNYYKGSKGYYCSLNGKYYDTYAEAMAAANGQSKYVTYVGNYGLGYRYYSSYTGRYYDTYQEALNASKGISGYVTYVGDNYWYGDYWYGNYGYYYSSYTGKYYSSYSDALNASKGVASYVTHVGYLYNRNIDDAARGSIYKYYYNGVAYPTLDAAKKAGGTVGVDIYYSIYGNSERVGYYYYYNGTYYGTIEAAKKAGGTDLGVDITYVPYNYYGNAYNNYYGYYGYYGNYGYYGYIDPYYVVRNDLLNKNKVTATKEAEDGVPYIYGNKKKAGWDIVIKYINAASKGSNIKVDMNGATTVSKDVLKALDGKNVSVTFVLDNGVKWTVNGKDVDTAQDMLIYTKYNIDYIPEKLVSKASKDAVSKAQIGISNDYSSFGSEASVTVRFSDKRAGCIAVVYRYDPDANSLKGVDKAKVQSDGSCTFSVTAGGPYLIVLK